MRRGGTVFINIENVVLEMCPPIVMNSSSRAILTTFRRRGVDDEYSMSRGKAIQSPGKLACLVSRGHPLHYVIKLQPLFDVTGGPRTSPHCISTAHTLDFLFALYLFHLPVISHKNLTLRKKL
jgi:hypothetical protein